MQGVELLAFDDYPGLAGHVFGLTEVDTNDPRVDLIDKSERKTVRFQHVHLVALIKVQ